MALTLLLRASDRPGVQGKLECLAVWHKFRHARCSLCDCIDIHCAKMSPNDTFSRESGVTSSNRKPEG